LRFAGADGGLSRRLLVKALAIPELSTHPPLTT
jgi:hypothetical protein